VEIVERQPVKRTHRRSRAKEGKKISNGIKDYQSCIYQFHYIGNLLAEPQNVARATLQYRRIKEGGRLAGCHTLRGAGGVCNKPVETPCGRIGALMVYISYFLQLWARSKCQVAATAQGGRRVHWSFRHCGLHGYQIRLEGPQHGA
jgi:hypothetical protein